MGGAAQGGRRGPAVGCRRGRAARRRHHRTVGIHGAGGRRWTSCRAGAAVGRHTGGGPHPPPGRGPGRGIQPGQGAALPTADGRGAVVPRQRPNGTRPTARERVGGHRPTYRGHAGARRLPGVPADRAGGGHPGVDDPFLDNGQPDRCEARVLARVDPPRASRPVATARTSADRDDPGPPACGTSRRLGPACWCARRDGDPGLPCGGHRVGGRGPVTRLTWPSPPQRGSARASRSRRRTCSTRSAPCRGWIPTIG